MLGQRTYSESKVLVNIERTILVGPTKTLILTLVVLAVHKVMRYQELAPSVITVTGE